MERASPRPPRSGRGVDARDPAAYLSATLTVASVFSGNPYMDVGAILILLGAGGFAIAALLVWRSNRRGRPLSSDDGSLALSNPEAYWLAQHATPMGVDQHEPEWELGAWLNVAAGQNLQVLIDGDDPARWWRRSYLPDLSVVADGKRVAIFSWGSTAVAHIACMQGSWRLQKQRRYGWDFSVESDDGLIAGQYAGRRWRPGGTIQLADDPEIELRCARRRHHWQLRLPGEHAPLVGIRVRMATRKDRTRMAVAVHSVPPSATSFYLALLTAIAVISLENAFVGGGGGG